MRRGQMHLEAELRWHDELDAALGAGTLPEGTTLAEGTRLAGYTTSADNQPHTED